MSTSPQTPIPDRRRRSLRGRLRRAGWAVYDALFAVFVVFPRRRIDRFLRRMRRWREDWLNIRLRIRSFFSIKAWREVVRESKWQANALFFGHRVRYLLRAILAFMMLGVFIVGGWFGWQKYVAWRSDENLAQGVDALAVGNFPRAIECYAWLVDHNPEDAEARFHLAEAYAGAGDKDLARELMATLTSETAIGYAPALAWLAKDAILDRDADEATFASFEHQLKDAISVQPQEPAPREVLALAYLRRDRVADAEKLIEADPKLVPDAAFELARWHAQEGHGDQARSLAKRIEPAFQQRTLARQEVVPRLRWAEVVGLAGNHQDVAHVLTRGVELHGPDPFARELVELYLQYGDTLRNGGAPPNAYSASYQQALDVLDRYPVPDSDFLRYRALLALEQYSDAELRLMNACKSRPDLYLELAHFRHARNDLSGARLAAQSATQHFQEQLRRDPADEAAKRALSEAALYQQVTPEGIALPAIVPKIVNEQPQ